MITAYHLFDFTGQHKSSRSRWLMRYFNLTSRQAKLEKIYEHEDAEELLKRSCRNPRLADLEDYYNTHPTEFKLPEVKQEPTIPLMSKSDYEILKDSFDDLLEMYHNVEQRLLVLEKRTELPKRGYRIEIINIVNDIAKNFHKSQQELYKEIYKGFDARFNISTETKKKETTITYMEWYDKHDYLPKLLNYIKNIYKV